MSGLIVASAFGAGLAASIGPCVAPRYLALAALVTDADGRTRWARVAAFVSGLLLCYVALATAASLIGELVALSQAVYIGLAASFLVFGLRSIVVRAHHLPNTRHHCSPGAAALTGGALGLVVSPCCTPTVAALAGVASLSGSPLASMALALAFAAGHVAPLALAGLGLRWIPRVTLNASLQRASSAISGGLSIAVACYYGLLA